MASTSAISATTDGSSGIRDSASSVELGAAGDAIMAHCVIASSFRFRPDRPIRYSTRDPGTPCADRFLRGGGVVVHRAATLANRRRVLGNRGGAAHGDLATMGIPAGRAAVPGTCWVKRSSSRNGLVRISIVAPPIVFSFTIYAKLPGLSMPVGIDFIYHAPRIACKRKPKNCDSESALSTRPCGVRGHGNRRTMRAPLQALR